MAIQHERSFKLKRFLECLAHYGIGVNFYVDRAKFYVDATTDDDDLRPLQSLAKSQRLNDRELSHYHTLCIHVDVLQPSERYFQELSTAIRGDYRFNYIELAMDFMVQDEQQRERLHEFFNCHIVYKLPNGSFYFYKKKDTIYFGARCQKARSKKVLVTYSDKPSKAKVSPHGKCVHIELRLSGIEMLKAQGIYTIQDICDFDHDSFWRCHLDLRSVEYQKLGALLSTATTSQGRIQVAKRALNNYAYLQQALCENPMWIDALKPIDDKRKMQRWLGCYLGKPVSP